MVISPKQALEQKSLDQIFNQARTHSAWTDQPISDEILRRIYDLMKLAPTSTNTSPARILFIKSPEQKKRLLECVAEGNFEKTKAAPVTAVIAQDMEFYKYLPKLFPHATEAQSWFEGNEALIRETAFRNSSLQGAYLILAARALGLDCGPMSGFNSTQLDEVFFNGTNWKSNFICNLGYGDDTKLRPRGPRLDFEEACRII